MRKIILIIAALAFLTISSCKKEDEKTTPAKTKTELLTSKPWKSTALTINPGLSIDGPKITDFFAQMPSCSKDDTDKYNVGGTGVNDEGATKCHTSNPQSTPFTWVFHPSETILTRGGESQNIIQLDETTLKVSTVVDGIAFLDIGGIPGLDYTITYTYSNQ
jgi:hypothetical protein